MHRAHRWNGGVHRVAVIGNHLPRRCGIATFTTDLTDAIAAEISSPAPIVLAMNDPGHTYNYPARVAFEIGEGDVASYRRAAVFLNVNAVDVVSLQHEYGIFGGKAGVFILDLIRDLRMPTVTTLHTILAEPNPAQRRVMNELTALSERIVVMSADGADLLHTVHGVERSKIDVIPHGIPLLPAARDSKRKLGLEDNEVILTFGLLSPDKGIENVIDALPTIVRERPKTQYVVLGVTHPHIKEREGEAYRLMLETRAKRMGVSENVVFHDRFVSHEELVQFISAADIYITPYLKAEQITSGTLAYAVGSGKAVISTPYRYARELLADGRGVLVPWKDPAAIAREVIDLLANESKRTAMQQRAASHGKKMSWPVVGRSYLETFEQARVSQGARVRAGIRATTLAHPAADLPDVNLAHLRAMTDDTGLLQHATYSVPRYDDGYCLDDNARALLVMTKVEEAGTEHAKTVRTLASRYLAFVNYALDRPSGRFRNFMSYSRAWEPELGSDDSHGRALWSLGTVVGRSSDRALRGLASQLFHAALPTSSELTSPRAWAYALLGIDEYLRAFEGESGVQNVRSLLTDRLLFRFDESQHTDWPWFEDRLTYCNARLPQALILSGARMDNERATSVGLRALSWLTSIQTIDGYFAPIGSNGFYVRGEKRAEFDQQPVEASATISACLDAHRLTGEARWLTSAQQAFSWFLGENQLQIPLYDSATGGCRDGLHADRANENEGAESTVSFLLSLLEMREADRVAGSLAPPARLAVTREEEPLRAAGLSS